MRTKPLPLQRKIPTKDQDVVAAKDEAKEEAKDEDVDAAKLTQKHQRRKNQRAQVKLQATRRNENKKHPKRQ